MIAVCGGRIGCVELLSKYECVKVDNNKYTALMWAASKNRPECIPYLLSELGLQSKWGSTALHCASLQNHPDCVKYLLKECDIANIDGKTALQIAKEEKSAGCIKIIESYLQNNMFRFENINDWWIAVKAGYLNSIKKYYQQYNNERTEKGESSLMLATLFNHKDCVKYLSQFELGLINQEGITALMHAASRNCFECIQFLSKELKMQDQKGKCALHYVCEYDCPQAATLLFDEIDIKSNDGKSSLQVAIEYNSEDCKNVFQIQQKLVLNAFTQDDWFLASKYGNISAIKYGISQYKGQKNKNNQTALLVAVHNNQKSIVEYLSQYECGQMDGEGRTALMHSVINNRFDCIKYLHSELKMKDNSGKTALHYACIYKCTSSIKLLACEIRLVDNEGKSALMHAVCNNNISCIQYLQNEIGIKDNSGQTALIYACLSSNTQGIIQLLHEYNITNKDGKSPLQICEDNGFKECAKIIKEYSKQQQLFTIKSDEDWFISAKFGYINSIMQYSKKYQQKRNTNGETALMLAVKFQRMDCVEYLSLFEIGLADNDGKTALIHATENNEFLDIPLLVNEMKTRDKSGMTALHHVCSNNQFECVKYLLEEISIYDNDGQTPLEIAKEKGSNESVKIIENYINTKQWFEAAEKENISFVQQEIIKYQKSQNQFGQTALILSVLKKIQRLTDLLSQYETGVADDSGKTALIYAAINNLPSFIPFLTKELKFRDKEGKTVLYYACQYGFMECAKLLLEESGIPNNSLTTPTLLAKQWNNKQLFTILSKYQDQTFQQIIFQCNEEQLKIKQLNESYENGKQENEKLKQENEQLKQQKFQWQRLMFLQNQLVAQELKKEKGHQ